MPPWEIAIGFVIFLLAGTVKGLVGLGLPTVALAFMSLVLSLPEAMAMLVLPTIFTNVWQAAVGGNFRVIFRRQWPLILPLMTALYVTMWQLGQKGPSWASLVLGAVLILYGAMGLLRIRPRVSKDLEKPLGPVIGVLSGFIASMVGVPVVPLMPYLQALDIRPSEIVQTLGIVLCATSFTLAASLINFGLFDGPRALLSAGAVVPSIAGMWFGQRVRAGLSVEQFRLAVFTVLLAMGLYTVVSRLLW
jgi:uncharacterized membrane protein YfcA